MYTQSTFCFLLAHGAPSSTPCCIVCQLSSETTEGRPAGNDSYSAVVLVCARLAVDGLMRTQCCKLSAIANRWDGWLAAWVRF
jgi:hypothetical protein